MAKSFLNEIWKFLRKFLLKLQTKLSLMLNSQSPLPFFKIRLWRAFSITKIHWQLGCWLAIMLNLIIYKNVQKIKLSAVTITFLDLQSFLKVHLVTNPSFKQLLGHKIGWRLCSIFQHWYGRSDSIFISVLILCVSRDCLWQRGKNHLNSILKSSILQCTDENETGTQAPWTSKKPQ